MYGARDRARTRAVEVMDVMDVIHFVRGPMTTGLDPCQKCVEMCGPNDVSGA